VQPILKLLRRERRLELRGRSGGVVVGVESGSGCGVGGTVNRCTWVMNDSGMAKE
jgi:hypothetical protein